MPENEIFAQILSDFVTANPAETENSVLKDFCEYAKKWLVDKGVIGVAQTLNGFALRFSDGTERVLLSAQYRTVGDQPAMSISSSSGGTVRAVAPIVDTSFKITG
jgi:hypothetical protein